MKAITDQLHWFAGTPIRNVATLGGNIANASPISDLNPGLNFSQISYLIVWLALDAKFRLKSLSEERLVDAKEFFIGYKKTELKPNEIIVSIGTFSPTT